MSTLPSELYVIVDALGAQTGCVAIGGVVTGGVVTAVANAGIVVVTAAE